MNIPAHLKDNQTHGGLPVPRVVATTKGRSVLVPTGLTGFPSTHLTAWEPHNSVPDFGKYDDAKQRECVTRKLCHVCWRDPAFLLVCSPKPVNQWIQYKGKELPMVVQPWVCDDCLRVASAMCPPLRTAMQERRAWVACVITHHLVSTYYKPAYDGDPVPPPGATVISSIKIAIERAQFTTLTDWVRNGFTKASRNYGDLEFPLTS